MRIPKYWARGEYTLPDSAGKSSSFTCWRWSDISVEDASHLANAKAKEIATKFQNRQQLDRYSYARNPLREEVVQSIKGATGNELGVVTRNLYGALVLNAANAMFIDIDFPQKDTEESVIGGIGKLLGNKAPPQEQVYIQNIEQWMQKYPEWGMRIYRTFGGLRCLITNEIFDPTQESSLDILRRLGSDPLYIKLCRQQESFRARLTPKPWRCNAPRPPSRYPWESPVTEQRYREWEKAYDRATSGYTACRLIKEIGKTETRPDISAILSIHDDLACSPSNDNLA